MRDGAVAGAVAAAVLAVSAAAFGVSSQARLRASLQSVAVPGDLIESLDPVQTQLRWIKSDGQELTGVAWVRVERHPLADRTARPRRGPPIAVPVTLAAYEDRTDSVDIPLPTWASGPMRVVVGHRPRTRFYKDAPFYVVNPSFPLPEPELGRPCYYEPVLEGPGYNFTGPDGMPSDDAKEVVVRSLGEWMDLLESSGVRVPESWGYDLPADAPIEARYARPVSVDFEKEMVLALFKGLTGAEEQFAHIVVRRLHLGLDGVLRCDYAVTRKGLYTFPLLEDFSPFLMVVVPKTDAPIEFRRVR